MDSQKIIIVEPLGGLANRMRTIASAIWLKKQSGNADLKIVWKVNYELSCGFEYLFEKNSQFEICSPRKINNYLVSSNRGGGLKLLFSNLKNRLIGVDYCITEPDFPNFIRTGKLDILTATRSRKNIYIKTCHEFGDILHDFEMFSPIESLRSEIKKASKDFDAKTIGVHIRRTDNELSIANSPESLFIERMHGEIIADENIRFFVCSDEKETINSLKNIFGKRMITRQKEISRSTVKGMQDAVIDMYCLANTSKILGSFHSSFSEISARINGIPMEVVSIKKNGAE